MARIRTIKPEFWTSEQVMGLKPVTRLLFIGMWNFADDYGRMAYAPGTIKAQVMPCDPVSIDEMKEMLAELSAAGLIIVYSAGGKDYIEVTGWSHQKIDKPHKPKFPAPYSETPETFAEHSPKTAEASPLDIEQEGNGKGKKEESAKQVRAAPDEKFEEFWKVYPKTPVMSKKEALTQWQKLSNPDRAAALAAVAPFKAWLAKQKDHPVVHACRFLSQRRFEGFEAVTEVASDKVFVREGTDAWLEWQRVRKTPCVNGGWYFDSEYPPSQRTEAA